MDLLLLLIERAGEIVDRKELLARAWPGVTIEDITFRAQMTRLKKALGDGGQDGNLIKSIPGQGYSFVVPVRRETQAGNRPPRTVLDRNPSPSDEQAALTNLPSPLTPMIGRESELAELVTILERGRLVTITGLGGVGKTKLAVELGRHEIHRFSGGVWAVDLTAPPHDSEFLSALAAVLGVPLVNPGQAIDLITLVLSKRPVLLILDKCEHVLRHLAMTVESLLTRVPTLKIIVTSEEPLRLSAEQLLRLKPLSLPPAGAANWTGYGATDLFVELAGAAGEQLVPGPENARIVTEICRRLDGIPLAIELAAAALPRLGLSGLLASLSQTESPPGSLPSIEKITMRRVMAWSYSLLDKEERLVFRRLAIFAGGFSLEAASAVAGPGPSEPWDIIDTVGHLIEKSLVMVEYGEGPRYRLLETVRQFAIEKLNESEEAAEIAERHSGYFAAWLEAAFESWETEPEAAWRARHEPEIDNIRTALDWALGDPARAPLAVAMAGSASRVLYYGHMREAQHYADLALNLLSPTIAVRDAARLLTRAGALWAPMARERALSLYERAGALYRESHDSELAIALSGIGVVSVAMGRNAEAKASLLEARNILLADGIKKKALLGVHSALGNLARNESDFETARKHYEDAMAVARLINEVKYEGAICQYWAELEFRTRNIKQALELGRDAVSCMRRANWPVFLTAALSNFTSYLLAAGNISDAKKCAEELSPMASDFGGYAILISLSQWALIGALEGDVEAAAKLAGFVEAGFATHYDERGFTELFIQEQLNKTLKAVASESAILAHKSVGAKWSEGEAVTFAKQRLMGQTRDDQN